MDRDPHRRARALALLILLAPPACWGGQQSLPPPEVAAQVNTIEREAERVGAIREVMRRDLGRVTALRQAFFEVPPDAYAPPFPLDTFRHAAMSCLQQPHDGSRAVDEVEGADVLMPEEASLPEEVAAKKFGVTCTPRALISLDEALEQPTHRALAREQLGRVDELRELSARIEARALKVNLITRRARTELADWRARRRQLVDETRRRELDYDREGWAETQRRLRAYEDSLARLATAIEDLEDDRPNWLPVLEQQTSDFTYDLAGVGLF